MNQLDVLVMVFSILFLAQTAIFSYLLLRMRRRISEPALIGELRWPGLGPSDLTETEMKIMELIDSMGPQSARDLSRALGLSREHVARTLKRLVEGGFLIREGKPYKYRLTELGRGFLRSRDVMGGGESS